MTAPRTHIGTILVLWGAGLGAAAQYAKISIVFDQLPEIYPDAGTALGFIVSLVGLVGILFGTIAGLLVARVGYRFALVTALWTGAAVSLLEAMLPALPVMLGLRALEGFSHLVIVVVAPTLIAQYSAPRHRGMTLTLWSTFFGVAFSLLMLFGRPLVEWGGVGALIAAHAVWMAAFAVLVQRLLPELPKVRQGVRATRKLWASLSTIYRSPFVAAPGVGWLFYTLCFLALLTVLPRYIAPEWRTWVIGVMPLVSILASLTLGVLLLRFLSAIAVVQVGFVASIAALVWLLAAPGAPAACMALAVALGLVQGATFASVPQLNDTAESQAQANGAMAQMGNLGNTLGTPFLQWTSQIAGYPAMIAASIALFGCGLVAHVLMQRRRRTLGEQR